MLNENDYKETKYTLDVIRHVKDDESPSRISFVEILGIVEFVAISISAIMFTKEGKPKNKLQLVLSIPAIVRFAKEFLRRLNKEARNKRIVKIAANTRRKADDK